MGSKSFLRAIIVSGGLLGTVVLPAAVATAEPIPVSPYTEIDEPVDQEDESESDTGDSGSSFSGPGLSGSSTTGSSGSFNTGSQDGPDGSGSVENAVAGFVGRLLRGVVTGS
ncbi:hypothetical protein [Nocardia sp. NPDC060259]|uniref:hypothetical protein n=1 Tax=Nocardia sp. NPDC060259 TaxID=3347088 RepID=UPI003659E8E9